jgi:hypothetical protein
VDEQQELTLAFGPVGLAGWGLLVLGILVRSRLLALAVSEPSSPTSPSPSSAASRH